VRRRWLVYISSPFADDVYVDGQAQQGEVKVQAHTANLRYKTEIAIDVPATALVCDNYTHVFRRGNIERIFMLFLSSP